MKPTDTIKTILWLTVFSVVMAYLESAVVVYLRVIMYPEGFEFPLTPLRPDIAITEIFREAATIVMLLSAGYLGGRYFAMRVASFLYCFAVWDIFYYVFLKILINWPASLMTWDILFMIPVTWTGPVICPVIVSITMIVLTTAIVYHNHKHGKVLLNRLEWIMLISGSIVLFLAFIWDYSAFILRHFSIGEVLNYHNRKALFELSNHYIPDHFPWILFALGETVILSAIGLLFKRYLTKKE